MGAPSNPFRRFSVLLALFLVAGSTLVVAAVDWQLQDMMLRQTVSGTSDAINRHADLFDLPRTMVGLADAASPAEHNHGASGYAAPVGGTPSTDPAVVMAALAGRDPVIRMHMDIYGIKHAAFIDKAGTVLYSYNHDEVGKQIPPDLVDPVRGVLGTGQPWQSASWLGARTIRLIQPVLAPGSGGIPVGAVVADRDLADLWGRVRAIQIMVAALMFALAAALYLALRQVFLRATLQIRSQTTDLSRALSLVEATYDSTLKALTSALDFRDTETEGHSQRVTAFAVRLAQETGVADQALIELTRGAVLHDVGKIGVPDSILRKPGPLTSDEWKLMREHPTLGYEMLKAIPFLVPALPLVLHHHERYDGSGYPDSLAGDAIPLGARIFAVCDTLDAICSNRPYRSARSFADARAEILRSSGTQFDPAVVEAFLRIPEADWDQLRRLTARPDPATAVETAAAG